MLHAKVYTMQQSYMDQYGRTKVLRWLILQLPVNKFLISLFDDKVVYLVTTAKLNTIHLFAKKYGMFIALMLKNCETRCQNLCFFWLLKISFLTTLLIFVNVNIVIFLKVKMSILKVNMNKETNYLLHIPSFSRQDKVLLITVETKNSTFLKFVKNIVAIQFLKTPKTVLWQRLFSLLVLPIEHKHWSVHTDLKFKRCSLDISLSYSFSSTKITLVNVSNKLYKWKRKLSILTDTLMRWDFYFSAKKEFPLWCFQSLGSILRSGKNSTQRGKSIADGKELAGKIC